MIEYPDENDAAGFQDGDRVQNEDDYEDDTNEGLAIVHGNEIIIEEDDFVEQYNDADEKETHVQGKEHGDTDMAPIVANLEEYPTIM